MLAGLFVGGIIVLVFLMTFVLWLSAKNPSPELRVEEAVKEKEKTSKNFKIASGVLVAYALLYAAAWHMDTKKNKDADGE